jgi:hypothetical protein
MKKTILYFSIFTTFSFLSCQKDTSRLIDADDTQANSSLSIEGSMNLSNIVFHGSIVARRTDTDMSPAYKELFTKNINIEAVVLNSRGNYYGLTVMPPAHVTYATGYSCPQGSQSCNLENVAMLDMSDIRDDGRGIMSWITAILGFN